MGILNSVKFSPLLGLNSDRLEVVSDLSTVPPSETTQLDSAARQHGTFMACTLSAQRDSLAPAICADYTLLVRPIFAAITSANGDMPSAKSEGFANATLDSIRASAHALNLGCDLGKSTPVEYFAAGWCLFQDLLTDAINL